MCEELRVDGGTSKPGLSANPRAARGPRAGHCLFHRETLCQTQRNQAQGCASAARNPKGPQITPFGHQMGRHKRSGRGSDAKLDQNFAPDLSRGVPGSYLNFLLTIFDLTSGTCNFVDKKMCSPPGQSTELGKGSTSGTYFSGNCVSV